MNFEFKITVFTPTFNRAYILSRLYKSIQQQKFTNFEWLIVDDGSTDNTENLVRDWIDENNNFLIRYYKKDNGGKCRAINYGVELANGELFFIMDSDDYLTDDALEKIVYWEKSISNKDMICGLFGNRGTSATETPNTLISTLYGDNIHFVDDYAFARYSEYTNKVIDGERAEVFYTSVLKKYKYPEFSGENFMTEAVIWNRMACDGYRIRFFDDIIWICKYLEDGLTLQGNMLFLKNPKGEGLCLKEKASFLRYSFIQRFKMYYSYYCDHTYCASEYKLNKKQCAEYIGTSIGVIYVCELLHKLIRLIK